MCDKTKRKLFYAAAAALVMWTAVSVWLQTELSVNYFASADVFPMSRRFILLNGATILVLWSVFCILCNRVWLSSLLLSFCGTVISLINYYTITLHGMPLSVNEIRNAATAMNVLSTYRLEIGKQVIWIGLLFLVTLPPVFAVRKLEGKPKSKRGIFLRDFTLVLMSACVLYFGYLSPNPLKPRNMVTWDWNGAYHQYGYAACTVESIQQSFRVIKKPEGYTAEKAGSISVPAAEEKAEYTHPDIILILNETWYDMDLLTELETDTEYRQNLKTMPGLQKGYAVVPIAGGGTNCSEYELLTGNSLKLMPGATPFNVLDLQGANSLVSHLERLGYATFAAHIGQASNYSRANGYPALGFDTIRFMDSMENIRYNGSREYGTDAYFFEEVEKSYESMPNTPRFLYLLTIQNHGGFEMAPAEEDTVHVIAGGQGFESELNEYLSSLKLTDSAFRELTDYYSQVDRPVIICMVGDHAPDFAVRLADKTQEGEEKRLRLRQTPFVIWTNYDSKEGDLGSISMPFLGALLLREAGVELSAYYRYMLDLAATTPVVTSYGICYDADGNFRFVEDSPDADKIRDYYYLEYNNLSKYQMQEWFAPDGREE